MCSWRSVTIVRTFLECSLFPASASLSGIRTHWVPLSCQPARLRCSSFMLSPCRDCRREPLLSPLMWDLGISTLVLRLTRVASALSTEPPPSPFNFSHRKILGYNWSQRDQRITAKSCTNQAARGYLQRRVWGNAWSLLPLLKDACYDAHNHILTLCASS